MVQQHGELRKVFPFHCSLPASLVILEGKTHKYNFQLLSLLGDQVLTKFRLCI